MTDHECTFVEEQEPSGRLILGPCLECGVAAIEAMADRKDRIAQLEAVVEAQEAYIADLVAGDTSPEAGLRYQRRYDALAALEQKETP